PNGAFAYANAFVLSHNANRRKSVTLPNGVVITFGYDAASRVTSVTHGWGWIRPGRFCLRFDLPQGMDLSAATYLPAARRAARGKLKVVATVGPATFRRGSLSSYILLVTAALPISAGFVSATEKHWIARNAELVVVGRLRIGSAI